MKRVLVTGSRSWTDTEAIATALAREWEPGAVLVTGGCPTGADAIAALVWPGVVELHPADWSHGKSAGPRRNAEIVALGADVCLAFSLGTKGTEDTVRRARQAGIRTVVVVS